MKSRGQKEVVRKLGEGGIGDVRLGDIRRIGLLTSEGLLERARLSREGGVMDGTLKSHR
jgi:hypothetical protein